MSTRTCVMPKRWLCSARLDALWEALLVVNPIAVTERLANASLRQRNAYFSSSDAAFRDRYQAER